jgi:CRP-like cAMP-binding protein
MQQSGTNRNTSRLSAADVTVLAEYGARTTWPAGFQIYHQGAAADGMSVVLRGHVLLRNRSRSGRGFVPAIVTPGETFGVEGISSDAVYVSDACASDDAETLYVSGEQFRAFVRENPGPALQIIGHLMTERAGLLQKLHAMASQNVENRLVTALERLSHDRSLLGNNGRLRIELKHHRLLCEMVGATRESIALAFGRLVGAGVVERKGMAFVMSPKDLAAHISGSPADIVNGMPVVQESLTP